MFFTGILGHEFQKEALRRAVRERRIPHAYLFSGPDGVGKKLVAIEFAKMLNCAGTGSDSKDADCGCNSCKKIERGIHADVFLVRHKGVKDIKVDQIREEVEERIFFRPFEGRFKVAILDEAERMNQNAQNAFLKTLEEPPPDSVIILITSDLQALLPTVRSRCQSFEFSPLSQEAVVEEVIRRKNVSYDEATLRARLSRGSLGKALSMDEDIISQGKELISRLSKIDPSRPSGVPGFVESLPLGPAPEDVEKLMLFFGIISLWLRDVVLIKIGFERDSLSNRELAPLTEQVAVRWNVEGVLDKMRFLEKSWYAIFRGNANKQTALENLALKIAE